MRIASIILTLMVFSSSAFAECVTNARGHVVCNNGEQAGGYNAKTGSRKPIRRAKHKSPACRRSECCSGTRRALIPSEPPRRSSSSRRGRRDC